MQFGFKNALETFQRLINNFLKSLKIIFELSYLDDIIILSEIFQEHLSDLSHVFTKLCEFKLCTNREIYIFVCERIGHYIPKSGLEVD